MTVTRNDTGNSSDDIDLLLVIEKALLFFRRFKWIFIIAIVLGIGLGIFAYSSMSKIYQSRLIAHSFILTNQENIQIVNNWNRLLRNREYATLAKTFNCREQVLHPIKKLKAEEIQKVFSANNPHGFAIEVNVTDNSMLGELQNGIVYAFDNSEYIKQRLEVKRADLKELINKAEGEIGKLELTKTKLEGIMDGKEKILTPLIVEGSNINKQVLEMNEKLLGYKQELKFANAIQVLQGFGKFDKPIGPKLIPWLVIGIVFFLALAWVYVLYRYISQKIKARSSGKITALT